MVPGLLSSVMPVPQREAGARPQLHLVARRDLEREPGRHQRAGARRQRQAVGARLGRQVGAEVHAGGAVGGVGGQRQRRVAAGQAQDADGDGHASASAMRSASRSAVASLAIRGQGSAPAAVIERHGVLGAAHDAGRRADVVGEDPVGALARALGGGVGDDVVGLGGEADDEARPAARGAVATVRRMSGFSAQLSAGGLPEASFFTFEPLASVTRQSATAAAKIATSAGSAASTAASISAAVSTSTTAAPGGRGASAGPVTKVTRAPRRASAAAIAVPWRPDERLAM